MSGELGGLLSKRATFLFGVEAQLGVNPGLDPHQAAIEVQDPDWTTNPTVLERDFVSNDLSPFDDIVGRIIAGFKVIVEVVGNGRQQSGNLADAPLLARMIQCCGYELYAMTNAGTDCHSSITPDANNAKTSPLVAWVSTADVCSVTAPVQYYVQVVTAGGSGAAQVIVTSNSKDEDAAMGDEIIAPVAQVLTSGQPLSLGAKGGKITPTWAGNLTVGQAWTLATFPRGIKAKPISTGFHTASMELNRDGLHLEGNAGLGTFTIDATAGAISKATFNFTTTFVEPNDALLPDVDYGNPLTPSQVELSTLTWGGNRNLTVEKWTLDQSNDIQARPSVNAKQGYAGSRLVSRKPSIGFNPEATHEADQPFWQEFVSALAKSFITRIGTQVGNQLVVYAGRSQTSDTKFADRQGTMVYDKTIKPKRTVGNDELIFVFC